MSDSERSQASDAPPPRPWAKPGCITLRCRENGPLVVELPGPESGPVPAFRVIDHEGVELPLPADKGAVALCRCGQSARKPFCDGSHREAGFRTGEPSKDGA